MQKKLILALDLGTTGNRAIAFTKTGNIAASTYYEFPQYFPKPALVGLGAPYWDPDARGLFIGLTRGTTRNHLVRAALEAICYQTKDVIEEMEDNKTHPPSPPLYSKEGGIMNNELKTFKTLRVDGGAVGNDFLMQFQADILGMKVERPVITETTAFGAAGIAGLQTGFWTRDEFLKTRKINKVFLPKMKDKERDLYYAKWLDALKRAFKFA